MFGKMPAMPLAWSASLEEAIARAQAWRGKCQSHALPQLESLAQFGAEHPFAFYPARSTDAFLAFVIVGFVRIFSGAEHNAELLTAWLGCVGACLLVRRAWEQEWGWRLARWLVKPFAGKLAGNVALQWITTHPGITTVVVVAGICAACVIDESHWVISFVSVIVGLSLSVFFLAIVWQVLRQIESRTEGRYRTLRRRIDVRAFNAFLNTSEPSWHRPGIGESVRIFRQTDPASPSGGYVDPFQEKPVEANPAVPAPTTREPVPLWRWIMLVWVIVTLVRTCASL